ncbi:LacI family DNA-binding transcriptional regulator [Dactylosporangium sp. NPDC051541]|uniref:LacI family DNA-binding transcriptional regulator n=1 Tax=Dactylosporangium sp. NPDC051541 TaxID=3363977 RepID=UPI00379D31C5
MPSALPTISDVAQRAGVGIATVSRVLNGGQVRPQTRTRVLAAIEELGYRPADNARSLARGRRETLGVIVPFFTHPSAVQRLRGVLEVMGDDPIQVVAFNVATVEQRDRQLNQLRMLERTAGVIIVNLWPSDDDVAALHRAGIAAVLLDAEHPDLTRITVDDVHGGELATDHLLSLGHTRIAFIGDEWPAGYGFRSSDRRHQGYERALHRAGVAVRAEYLRQGPHGRDTAHRLTRELLARPEPPTAIFAASDTQALGVLEAVAAAGLRVPQDVSVIGFDDLEIAPYVGLTTIRQPLEHSGRRATELLMRSLRTGHDPIEERLPLELIVRHTTQRLRAGSIGR